VTLIIVSHPIPKIAVTDFKSRIPLVGGRYSNQSAWYFYPRPGTATKLLQLIFRHIFKMLLDTYRLNLSRNAVITSYAIILSSQMNLSVSEDHMPCHHFSFSFLFVLFQTWMHWDFSDRILH